VSRHQRCRRRSYRATYANPIQHHIASPTLTSSHSVLFSSTSSSLLAFPAASSTTRNTTGSTPYAAAASTTSNVAMTGSTDAGITPRTSGSRRTTNGTRISVSCSVGTRTPSSVRRTRARWNRAVRAGASAGEGGGGCKLRATAAGCWGTNVA